MEQNLIQNEEPSNDVLVELQSVLKKYLAEKPNRSMNGLSRKCVVSEPTLRRIFRGQIKTMPTATTVLDILTTISKEKNLQSIRKLYPGAISEYLDSNLPQAQDVDTEYSLELNNELNDSNSYLIYKLSSNSRGLKKEKLLELLGTHGVTKAEILLQKGYLSLSGDTYFAQVKNFTLNHSTFIQNFKCVADFLKTQNPVSKNNTHSLLVNYSESVSLDTYREIIAVQKKALKKIRDLMSDEKAQGEIPLCLLLAVDTLDTKSVHEFEN